MKGLGWAVASPTVPDAVSDAPGCLPVDQLTGTAKVPSFRARSPLFSHWGVTAPTLLPNQGIPSRPPLKSVSQHQGVPLGNLAGMASPASLGECWLQGSIPY